MVRIIFITFLLVSCASVHPSGRRPQVSDGIVGNGHLVQSVYRATVVSAIRQPITTARTGLAMLWLRPQELVLGNLPAPWIAKGPLAEAPGTPAFEKLLDRKHFPRAQLGSLKWLVDGEGFFPELDRQIAQSRKSIKVQIYIFDNDDIGVRYADRLKHRAENIKVQVLFDDLGSTFASTAAPKTLTPLGFSPPPDMAAYLRENSKIRVRRILNPWLVADHTKLLVFDHHTAILGGMNIGREYYSEWHDLMVRVQGPIVAHLSQEFTQAWNHAGPRGDFALIHLSRKKPAVTLAGSIPLRAMRTDAGLGRHEIMDSMILAIRGARRRIWIENPYLSSDEIAAAVASAAQRGVDVRIILPSTSDSFLMDASNLATANFLIRAGAKLYRYPRMAHTKAMICDGWATVGSANLDVLSMRINRELNLTFTDPATLLSLERALFLPDFRHSRRISLRDTEAAANGFAEAVADQF
ncbi:MAG: phosphatidylserine/phosphatidylglycerophosphate/cardiolipin synthase family protein [Gloeobacteraceae cyanobacterium ES-bin-144]|nr:phosphatidylserine/phosphatidylglycerophosphate/cardiolipin synthase family protein [Verrucomicrobiales bacterium]